MEAPVNRNLLRDLEVLPVDTKALEQVINGLGSAPQRDAAIALLVFLAKEEKGHHVLTLYTRPGLGEKNVPVDLHRGIDPLDRAAKKLCVSAVYAEEQYAALRAYAERNGYDTAAALIAGYSEARVQ